MAGSTGFKHQKKRNTGLVYEFLVRRLGGQLVDGDADGAVQTVALTEQHFGPGTTLADELQLFKIVRDTRGVSDQVARKVLGEVGRTASKMNGSQLYGSKSRLIHDLNRTFGRTFFDRHRLAEYRLLASIQLFLDGQRGKNITESVAAIRLEDGLVRWMTSSPKTREVDVDNQVDDLVCVMAAKRFNEKYGTSLNLGQKKLLETYVRSLVKEDRGLIQRKVVEDRDHIARILVDSFRLKEVQSDDVMKKRYVDATRRLSELDVSRADDNIVEEMMLYHRLVEELKSNG